MPELVIVRTFATEIEAELARATLEAHGIPAAVRMTDAAGLLRVVEGAKVVVRQEDVEAARELLSDGRGVTEEG
ncbi:MAG TPA: DUF2007 domain-containing protein [Gemmatimonadaceae bacterium]|nr:DUF2007 domain-containing protein [Gemmatimonadaceae bacterium]